jgi:SAM-dependent methyltransferase
LQDRTSETTAAGISWVQFHAKRRSVRDRYPSIWRLPVISDPFTWIASQTPSVRSALDVGATSRVWEPSIRATWKDVDYRSLDIDRTLPQDYYAFDDVHGEVDLVLIFEVLEHVSPSESLSILEDCKRICRPGGYVAVSVPNILTPGAQLEFTHQTSFSMHDVGALLEWCGLEVVDIVRAWPHGRRIAHRLLWPLHRGLQVDYCHSILALARKQ